MKQYFVKAFNATKRWLSGLSIRTGVILLVVCAIFYALSFAQMLLPLSNSTKVTLWIILFGMAKLTQYIGLIIVGAEWWRRFKNRLKRKSEAGESSDNNDNKKIKG